MRFKNCYRRKLFAAVPTLLILCIVGCKPEATQQAAARTGGNPPTALNVPLGNVSPGFEYPDPTLADDVKNLDAEIMALPQNTSAQPDPEIADFLK